MVQDNVQWRALVNMEMSLRDPHEVGNFCVSKATISFWRGLCSLQAINYLLGLLAQWSDNLYISIRISCKMAVILNLYKLKWRTSDKFQCGTDTNFLGKHFRHFGDKTCNDLPIMR
jgi:hypothetical protein